MTLTEAMNIVAAALPGLGHRGLRSAAVVYLNWWNGHSEAMPFADPTGERAVRRIVGYYDVNAELDQQEITT